VGAALIYADRQTDTHDEFNRGSFLFTRTRQKRMKIGLHSWCSGLWCPGYTGFSKSCSFLPFMLQDSPFVFSLILLHNYLLSPGYDFQWTWPIKTPDIDTIDNRVRTDDAVRSYVYRTYTCWEAHCTVPDAEASLQCTYPTMPPDNGVMPPACQPGSCSDPSS
jgi:hypothetical protein